MGAPVTVRLLGPVEAWRADRRVQLGGRRQCGVLAVLALRVGHVVPVADLVDGVWGESPPATARQQMHSAVSALRRALGDVIVTSQAGYQLDLPAEQVDVRVFETLVGQARQATDLAVAVDRWNDALALWRGPALAGVPSLNALAVGLEEQRLSVIEERIGAELELGRHKDLVADLSVLVATHPVRERLVGHLMIALGRCGRAADALEVYRLAEQRLANELGLDPGPHLNRLKLAVLRGDLALEFSAERPEPIDRDLAPLVTPAQLPADVTGFAGRAEQLAELDGLVLPAPNPGAPVTVVITGPAGVGKTALAVHWAHRVAAGFTDGQLYVDLDGLDPAGPVMTPAGVLRGFLEALRVERVPSEPAAMVGLFRSLVADRRMVIVLDNARDAHQVRPLLPGAPGCMVLVTSRDQMPGLVAGSAAHLVRLDVLSRAEAGELLAARIGEDRMAAEPDAVDDIVASCARLPLALVNVAARAAAHPGFPMSALAAELHPGADALVNVRAALSCSYDLLTPSAARVFRLLGRYPGEDISLRAAAELAGVEPDRARSLLAELETASMLTEHAPGRFTHHALLRAYASELADRVDGQSSIGHE